MMRIRQVGSIGRLSAVLALLAAALQPAAAIAWERCGNGVVDSGEQCDPGSGYERKPEGSSDCCDNSTCQFKPKGTTCDQDDVECTESVCDDAGTCSVDTSTPPKKGCGCCELGGDAGDEARHTDDQVCLQREEKACEDKKGKWSAGGVCLPSGACEPPAPLCGNGVIDTGEKCDVGPAGSPCCIDCQLAAAGTLCGTDGNACTDDVCNNAGSCVHENNNKSCSDGQFCTKNDTCSQGKCTGTAFIPTSCIDDNPCTNDLCKPTLNQGHGACAHPNNTEPCDDGAFCTVNDLCRDGQCASGVQRDCGGGNSCLIAACDEATDQCANQPDPSQNGQTCDDHDACTGGTTCGNGTCSGGTPLVCDDLSTCTVDSCNSASGCVFTTVVETPACLSCVDGVDNDGDTDIDAEDSACATLAALQRFAVISTATSGRTPLYSGSNVAVDAIAGTTAGSLAPYPIGNSRAGVCAFDGGVRAGSNFGIFATRGVIEFGSGSTLDPTLDDPEVDNGSVRSIDIRTQFLSDNANEIYKTIAPLVGPGMCSNNGVTACTESQASCTTQSAGACCAAPGALCSGRLRLDDASNPYVDRSGTAENFQRCVAAMAAMLDASESVASLAGNVAGFHASDEAEIRTGSRNRDATINVGGGGLRVIEVERIILAGHTSLTISGPADAVVVIRVRRQLRLGGEAVVALAGGLRPENVLWNIEGRFGGMPSFDRESQFNGTVLAPERRGIRCGGDLQISGALYAPRVHLSASTRISHRPFLGLVD